MKQTLETKTLYAISFILAACSIAYELLIADTIALLAGNTVVWYSLTIGVFLGGMGAGSLFYEKNKASSLWKTLFYVELGLVILGASSVSFIHAAQMLFSFFVLNHQLFLAATIFPIWSLLAAGGIGFLTGMELPLLMEAGERKEAGSANRVLGADYIGCLFGALVMPLILLPFLSHIYIGFLLALLNIGVAFFILIRIIPRDSFLEKHIWGLIFLALLIMLGMHYEKNIEQYFLKKYYLYYETSQSLSSLFSPMEDIENIERITSPYQKIDIFRLPYEEYPQPLIDAYSTKYTEDPNYPKNYYLFLNGDFQILSDTEDIYHEWFAHVPIILKNKIPENILILGAGDGLLDKELLKYPQVKNITHVDLDKKIIEAGKTHPVLSYMNKGSLDDPRVHIVIADGYKFIKDSTETFDAIYIDFPYPQDYNLGRLFSKEFYTFALKRLSDDGFLVLDTPGSEIRTYSDKKGVPFKSPGESWGIYYNTLRAAGFPRVFSYASMLEENNKKAFNSLDKLNLPIVDENFQPIAGSEEKLSEIESLSIKEEMRRHVETAAQGFMMATKNDSPLHTSFQDNKIKLHVLNKERFDLSVHLPYPTPETIDIRSVNSILKPKSFNSISWMIRRPY